MTVEHVTDLYFTALKAELEGIEFLASFTYEEMALEYNGIGPSMMSEKDRKRLTKWLKLFEPICLGHDMRFAVSDGTRESFDRANKELLANGLKISNHTYSWYNWKRYRARFVARVMYAAVCASGWDAWQKCYNKRHDPLKPVVLKGCGFALV